MRLHKYQEHAIDMIMNNTSCGLFMEMGLGKTISTLTAIQKLMKEELAVRRVLVIAPLAVANNVWRQEAEKWPHIDLVVSVATGTAKSRKEALEAPADVYVTNRENTQWIAKHWDFDMVVIDELSSFKSPSSKRFKTLKKLPADRVVGLTGTPSPNGLLDLWSQMYLLDGGKRLGRSITRYRDTYFKPSKYIFQGGRRIAVDYEPLPGAKDDIYRAIEDIVVSMKSEDWLELPERIDLTHYVELEDMTGYRQLEDEMILELEDDAIVAGSAAVVTQKLQQYAQGAVYTENKDVQVVHDSKLEMMDELVKEKPLLVFYWYKHDLARLQERYPEGVVFEGQVDEWNRGEIPLMFLHPASAGHGINLQYGGHHAVWFSLTWNLELYEQANARLNRQGQNKSVIIHHIVAKNTIDEAIMSAISSKSNGQRALMDALNKYIQKVKDNI